MHLHMYMPSKNVAVQVVVYNALKKERRPGESFTSLFRRLLNQREGLDELLGAWSREDARRARTVLRRLRSPTGKGAR